MQNFEGVEQVRTLVRNIAVDLQHSKPRKDLGVTSYCITNHNQDTLSAGEMGNGMLQAFILKMQNNKLSATVDGITGNVMIIRKPFIMSDKGALEHTINFLKELQPSNLQQIGEESMKRAEMNKKLVTMDISQAGSMGSGIQTKIQKLYERTR